MKCRARTETWAGCRPMRPTDMKPLWSLQQRSPFLTGVVSTAGNVAFVGDFDRVFRAVDTKTGTHLWKTRLGTTVQGHIASFAWTANSISR
jgi:alcohol dehydrogenase (cytochrome c)